MAQDYYAQRWKIVQELISCPDIPVKYHEFVWSLDKYWKSLSNAQYNLMLDLFNTYVLEPTYPKYYRKSYNINCHEHTASDRISQYRKLGIHKVVQGF